MTVEHQVLQLSIAST